MLLDYLIIPVYTPTMLGPGRCGTRKAKSQGDFLVAGRRPGPGLHLGATVAMVLGGASTIDTVRLGYQFGLSGLWPVFMFGLGIIVLSLAFSRQAACLRVFTVTQVLEQRYQTSSCLIDGVVMVAHDPMAAAAATITIGSVTEVVLGAPRIPAILCGGGIVIIYSVIGDMWSFTLADIIQFMIETVGIFLILLPLSINSAGGLTRMQEVLLVGSFDLGRIGLDTILTYFLLYFFGTLIGQDIWQRVFTACSETVVRHAGLSAGIYCMLCGAAYALVGATVRVLLPDLTMPEDVYAEITREILAPSLRGLVVVAALSAIMPTTSGYLLAAATVLQEDTYVRFLRPGTVSDVRLSRCITLLVGVAMLVLACLVNDAIVAPNITYNLLVGGLLVPTVGAPLWRWTGPQGVIANIVTGCLTVTVYTARDNLPANSPIVCDLLVNLAIFIAISPATRPAASLRAQSE